MMASMRLTKWLAILMVVSFSLPGCLDVECIDAPLAKGERQSKAYYHVGSAQSGSIDASYDLVGDTQTWNCCAVSGPVDDGGGPVDGASTIVGYYFAVEAPSEPPHYFNNASAAEEGLNVTLHGTNYSSHDYPPPPVVDVSGPCYDTAYVKTHSDWYRVDGTDYWGLFVQETVIDFDNDDDAAVMYEANKTVDVFVVMLTTYYDP